MAKSKPVKKVAEGPSFTTAQQQVIDHRIGPMLAGAVAGAGKSTTLVERVARLHQEGVHLNRILLSAFNVDAATDLNRKLKERLKMRGQDVEVARTLHSLALAVWKSGPDAEKMLLDTSGQLYTRAIRQGAKAIGSPVEVDLVSQFSSSVKNDCLVSRYVTGLRALGQTPEPLVTLADQICRRKKNTAMRAELLLDLFFAAETARTTGTETHDRTIARFVSFDDILAEAVYLLTDNDEIRKLWQERFDFVIVDEAQDLCEAQWRIVNAISERRQNLVVCGDPGQCVYRWRGARPEHMLKFGEAWPNAQQVFMDRNFRSGADIVRVANIVLDKIPASEKLPMTLHATRDVSGFVGYRQTESPATEAADITSNILKHRVAGLEWRDQAILVRRNDQTAALELALLRAKVPARIVRGQSFFATREAKTAIGYLRLIGGCATEDDFAVTISNPPKFLPRTYTDAIVKAWQPQLDWLDVMDASRATADRRYNGNARDFMGKIRELRLVLAAGATPLQLFTKVCEKMNWERWIEQDAKEDSPDNDASMNFDKIRDFLADFDSLSVLFKTLADLKAAQKAAAQSRNAVTVVTTHSAKGLEWSVVYIAGMVNKVWPVGWDEMIDERRVFYVAVTRARDELWLNGYEYKDDNAIEAVEPSPYLLDLAMTPTDRIGPQTHVSGQLPLI